MTRFTADFTLACEHPLSNPAFLPVTTHYLYFPTNRFLIFFPFSDYFFAVFVCLPECLYSGCSAHFFDFICNRFIKLHAEYIFFALISGSPASVHRHTYTHPRIHTSVHLWFPKANFLSCSFFQFGVLASFVCFLLLLSIFYWNSLYVYWHRGNA